MNFGCGRASDMSNAVAGSGWLFKQMLSYLAQLS